MRVLVINPNSNQAVTDAMADALIPLQIEGAPVYVWPGGGITLMVDVTTMPESCFGYVPTPAIVAPIEFTLRLDDYGKIGGHLSAVRRLEEIADVERLKTIRWHERSDWPGAPLPGTRLKADGEPAE